MKIMAITPAGTADVYNITVDTYHNFLIKGGVVLKNCDAIRYFLAGRPRPNARPAPKPVYNFEAEKPKADPGGYGEKVRVI